jgi:hypothetical protein
MTYRSRPASSMRMTGSRASVAIDRLPANVPSCICKEPTARGRGSLRSSKCSARISGRNVRSAEGALRLELVSNQAHRKINDLSDFQFRARWSTVPEARHFSLLVDYASAVRSSAVPAFGCGRPRNASLRWRLSIIFRAQGAAGQPPAMNSEGISSTTLPMTLPRSTISCASAI